MSTIQNRIATMLDRMIDRSVDRIYYIATALAGIEQFRQITLCKKPTSLKSYTEKSNEQYLLDIKLVSQNLVYGIKQLIVQNIGIYAGILYGTYYDYRLELFSAYPSLKYILYGSINIYQLYKILVNVGFIDCLITKQELYLIKLQETLAKYDNSYHG